MVRNWIGFFAVLCGSVVVLTAGCANEDFSSCEANESCPGVGGSDGGVGGTAGTSGTSGTGGTGATGGQGGQAGDGGGCDTSADPSTESCLVADDYAVFVDGTASTTGDGSKASPFKTIGEGLAAAKSAGKLVLVCDTNYDEQLNIDAGVRLYGGFKCTDWTYESGQKAVVKPAAKGYALEVSAVTNPVVIQDMEFDAQDGTDPGESSIAAFVHDSTGVAFDRVAFVAGKGVKGKDGVLVPVVHESDPAKLDGNDAASDTGGPEKKCACPAGGDTTGGAGGNKGQPGGKGFPDLGAGKGGQLGTCNLTEQKGANASPQGAASGATIVGTLSVAGFVGTAGGDGLSGSPGQGGGGGAGADGSNSGAGGGGGCGSCGGAGGAGGGAGGSSIGLVAFSSNVTTDSCTFTSLSAGDGGKGVAGQAGGTLVGSGGGKTSSGCYGGDGGKGGAGGAGGGAAGGISAGILSDTTSAITDSGGTFTHGAAGQAGAGGVATNGGVPGIADDKVQL
ncbi:MAG: hypothetical protein H6717_37565 [Polyangiaceae bacterium]|nr:hypothetical protein [Polyangiaceae bacterium]